MAGAPPPSPAAAAATTILGKYKIHRFLGRGSFAKVYLGISTKDETKVAIKVIDKSRMNPNDAPKIVTEVASTRRLNHPNIIRIDEVLATKSKIYLVMELAPGGDLHDKLLRRPDRRFPERMARRYFHQVVSALHFCHRHGVAHRDIKPGNILLTGKGDVKVSDFGLSAIANEGSDLLLETPCGTPAFSAPEVWAARPAGGLYDGAKADAWSCGILLYTMLVGALPFDDGNRAMMHRKMYRREFGFPSHVTNSARALIYKLLDPNPNTRMTIDDVTKNPWFKSGRFGPKSMSLGDLVSLNDESERVLSMNAFDIIGMNTGLNFSGLFDDGIGNKERRFMSNSEAEEVEERIVVEVGGKLGFEVEKGKGGKIWLGRGKLVLVVEFLELGPELLVEVRVVQGGACGGHGGGIGESQWDEIKDALGDVVASWHNVES